MPTFDPIFARDPGNPDVIASNATITIFDPADPTKTPIALTRSNGAALPNPYTVDRQGMGPAFSHPTLYRVGWEGGGFSNFFTAYEEMHTATLEARTASETAANLAEDAQSAAQAAASTAATEAAAAAQADLEARIAAGQFEGPQGKSAYQLAVEAGFVGTEAEWRASLKGLPGTNAVPADEAVGTYATTPGTATHTALKDTTASAVNPTRLAALAPEIKHLTDTGSTFLTRFETGHGWVEGPSAGAGGSVNLASSATNPFSNGAVTLTTGGGWGKRSVQKTVTAIDFTDKDLIVWVRVPDINPVYTIKIKAGSNASNYVRAVAYLKHGLAPTWIIRSGEVIPLRIPLDGSWNGDVVGTPNLAAITEINVEVADYGGSNIAVMDVLAVGAAPQQVAFPDGVVSFTIDDPYKSTHDILLPMLAAKGWPATVYNICDRTEAQGGLSLTQMRNLHDNHAWDISVHANTQVNHDIAFDSLPAETLDAEFRAGKQWMLDNGFTRGADHMAWPKGRFTPEAEKVARRYFSTVRSTHGAVMESTHPSMATRLRAVEFPSGIAKADLLERITRVKESGGWLIILLHDIADVASGLTAAKADVQELIDAVAATGVPVRSVSDVWRSAMTPQLKLAAAAAPVSPAPKLPVLTAPAAAVGGVASFPIPANAMVAFQPGHTYDVTLTSRYSTGSTNIGTLKLLVRRETNAVVEIVGVTNVQGTLFATTAGAMMELSATVNTDGSLITLNVKNNHATASQVVRISVPVYRTE